MCSLEMVFFSLSYVPIFFIKFITIDCWAGFIWFLMGFLPKVPPYDCSFLVSLACELSRVLFDVLCVQMFIREL